MKWGVLLACAIVGCGLTACDLSSPSPTDDPVPSGAPTDAPTDAPTPAPTPPPKFRSNYWVGDYGDTSDNPDTAPQYIAVEAEYVPATHATTYLVYMTVVAPDAATAYRAGMQVSSSGSQTIFYQVDSLGPHQTPASCYATSADGQTTIRMYAATGQPPGTGACDPMFQDLGIWR